MSANKREDYSVNTIIGPNTYLNGDINSAGFTRVDGSLRGNLTAAGRIVVGERARMKSNIIGIAVTIGGVVSGNVLASERVTILATGIVLGDIITRRIQVDEGCLLHGRITVCQTREKWDNAVNEYRDREDIKSVTAGFAPRPNPAAFDVPAKELSPEIVPSALEKETMGLAPAANQTPVFGPAALPVETLFAGEPAFPENAPDTPGNTVPYRAPVLPKEYSAENTPFTIDWAAFLENTPLTADPAAFPKNTPGMPENTELPPLPFPEAVDKGENYGED
jgi:cytoskeletal protein CcmA (bactofilin family)